MRTEALASSHYYAEVNIMRGILALLVILGHVLTQLDATDEIGYNALNAFGQVIYSFHMPAFFIVSGFVGIKAIECDTIKKKWTFIKNKFLRLMVPYFVMGILYLPFRILLSKIARSEYSISEFPKILIGENPDGALWFLYTLFLVTVITCLISTRKNIYIIAVITFLLYLSTLFVSYPAAILSRLATYLFFYMAGICIRMNYDVLLEKAEKRKWKIFAAAIVVFIIGNVLRLGLSISLAHILTVLSGTVMIWSGALIITGNEAGVVFKGCKLFGDYSMDMYIFGEPIKVVTRTVLSILPLLVMAPLTFVITVAASIFISWLIIRRVKVFRVLFLGERMRD